MNISTKFDINPLSSLSRNVWKQKSVTDEQAHSYIALHKLRSRGTKIGYLFYATALCNIL